MEVLLAHATLVLPWLKAKKWGSSDTVPGVASLTALSRELMFWGALVWPSLHPAEGLFGILNLRPCRFPTIVVETSLARKASLWFILT